MENKTYSIDKKLPPIGEYVVLIHKVVGSGAPEREGWESIGKLLKNGKFSIKQNESRTVDFRKPTHWKKYLNNLS